MAHADWSRVDGADDRDAQANFFDPPTGGLNTSRAATSGTPPPKVLQNAPRTNSGRILLLKRGILSLNYLSI
jgi:hypothetical protein